MDRLTQYRQIIKDTLKEYARLFNQQPEGIDVIAICDEEVDTYALINVYVCHDANYQWQNLDGKRGDNVRLFRRVVACWCPQTGHCLW